MTGSIVTLVGEYIQLRRGLGYRSPSQERALRAFARYLDQKEHHGPIPLEASLDWAASTLSADPCNPARRLATIRGFLRHLCALDGATEVPTPGLLGPAGHRRPPHVYSDQEIVDLLHAAAGLAPAGGLRPRCYATLFGLLACTGLRICEALALSCGDVDLAEGMLTVRAGKRGRTRHVPLHPSALSPLRDYAADRHRRYGPPGDAEAFFRTDRSDHISYTAANHTFITLRRRLGWTAVGRARVPRVHDLRHRMVVRRSPGGHPGPARPRVQRDDRALRQGSGIAPDGRETPGHQVIVALERRLRPACGGCLSRADTQTIPSDARCFRQKGCRVGVQANSRAAAPLPLLGRAAHALRCGSACPRAMWPPEAMHAPRRAGLAFRQFQYPTPPLRITDQTVRRRWEQATKVNIKGERISIDPDGPLAQAQWAKTRYGIATQTLPHGYCGLPVQKSCPHANACLTCPVFLTGPEFLPELREHRGRTLTLIDNARTTGQTRVTEMNTQVLANLDRMIGEVDTAQAEAATDAR